MSVWDSYKNVLSDITPDIQLVSAWVLNGYQVSIIRMIRNISKVNLSFPNIQLKCYISYLSYNLGSSNSSKSLYSCVLSYGQVFLLHPPSRVQQGDTVNIDFSMIRSKENHRLMEVELGCEIAPSSGKPLAPFKSKYYIEWQSGQIGGPTIYEEWTSKWMLMLLSFTKVRLLEP